MGHLGGPLACSGGILGPLKVYMEYMQVLTDVRI